MPKKSNAAIPARDSGLLQENRKLRAENELLQKRILELNAKSTPVTAGDSIGEIYTDTLENYRNQFLGSRAIMLVVDPENGSIIEANPAASEFYGYTHEELISKSIKEINIAPLEQVHAAMTSASNAQKTSFEFKHRLSDGQIRDVEVFSSPIIQHGKKYLFSIIHDITNRIQIQKSLTQSEAKFKQLVESAVDGILMFNLEGIVTLANSRFLAMTGYPSKEAVTGRSAYSFFDPSDQEKVTSHFKKTISNGYDRVENIRIIKSDGTHFSADIQAVANYDSNGNPVFIFGYCRDITARVQIEQELKSNAEQFQIISDLTTDDVFTLIKDDSGKLRIDWKFGTISRITGFSVDENQANDQWEKIINPDEFHKLVAIIQQQFVQESIQSHDIPVRAMDGSAHVIRITSKSIVNPETGKIEKIMGAIKEVTDQVMAEQAVLESEKLFRTIFENSATGIMTVAVDGKIIKANTALCQMLGYSKDDIANLNAMDIIPPEYLEQTQKNITDLSSGEISRYSMEKQYIKKDGNPLWVSMIATIVRDQHDNPQYLIIMVNDITLQKEAIRKIQLNEARQETLIELNQMTNLSLDEITRYALREAICLTESQRGFLWSLTDNGSIMHLMAVEDVDETGIDISAFPDLFLVKKSRLFHDLIMHKRPVIKNQMERSLDSISFPFDAGQISKILLVPILYEGKPVAVAAIANKNLPYDDSDLKQVTLLMTGMWRNLEQRKAIDSLRKSEIHTRRIIETASEGILEIDRNRRITFVNQQMAKLLGYRYEDLIGHDYFDLALDEDVNELQERLAKRFQGLEERYTQRLLRKTGEAIWFSISATPIRNEQGEINGSFAMFTDINEQILAMENLRQKDELLRNTIVNAPIILSVIDTNGHFIFSEGKEAKVFGLIPDQISGKNIYDVLYQYPGLLKDIQRALEGESFTSEVVLDGSVFDAIFTPFLRPDGTMAGTIIVATDITEKRAAEIKVHESEEKYLQIFKTSPIALTVSELGSAKLLDANKIFLDMYEYTREEVIGKSAQDLNIWVNPDDRAKMVSIIREQGTINNYEVKTRSKNGKQFTVIFTATIISYGGHEYLLSAAPDITERKKMETEIFESKQMLQTIFDSIPQRVFWKDTQFRYLGANRQFLMDCGLKTFGELIGKTDFEVVTDVLAQDYRVSDQYVIDNDAILNNFEEKQFIHGGGEMWVKTTKAPLHNRDGDVVGILATYEDITETREARIRLKNSEERFRNLAIFAPVGIYEKDANLRTIFVNQRLIDMSGFSMNNEKQFDDWLEGIHTDDVNRVRIEWENTILQGKDFYAEYRRILPDGKVLWIADHEAVLKNESGDISGYLGTLTDISPLKKAEEDIQRSLSLHLATLESTNDGILAVNLSGEITSQNQKFIDLWRIPGEIIPKITYSIIIEQISRCMVNPDGYLKKNMQIRMNKGERSFNVLFLADGRIFEEFSMPQILDNRIVGRVWSYQDVTSRYKAEEKLRQNNMDMQEMIKRLTALRNIDAAITGRTNFSDMVAEIIPNVVNSVNADAVALLIPHPDACHLSIVGQYGLALPNGEDITKQLVDLKSKFAGKAFRTRKMVRLSNMDAHPQNQISGYVDSYSEYIAVPLLIKNEVKGILEFFHKDRQPIDNNQIEFLQSVSMQIAIAIDNADLFNKMERTNLDLLAAYEATIEGWAKALELRDKETHGHSERVIDFTVRLAMELGISDKNLAQIRRGVFLHDIGKMAIPDSILLKPGPLTSDEWVIMKLHPSFAYEMLSGIPYLRQALDIPYCHHEKWDGTGYPRGLRGDEIPLAARIFTIVDVWDALSSIRPYRPAWPEEDIKAYIIEQSGKQFDPKIAEVFLSFINKIHCSSSR